MRHIIARLYLGYFTALFGAVLFFYAPNLRSSVDTSFLPFLYQAIPSSLDDEEMGIVDPLLNKQAHQVWDDVVSKGYSLCFNQSDKDARTIFGQLQTSIEQLMLSEMDKNKTSIWIFHTPLIPTPFVTNGEMSEGLIAGDILKSVDKTRVRNALSRAKLIREFLDKKGIIIVAYQKDLKANRSQEQLKIYEKLKKKYPKQIIELPLESILQDKIGATYIVETAKNDIFEMTNHGVQINQSQDKANWGIWLQMRSAKRDDVSARLCTQFQFLFANGLENALLNQSGAHGVAPEKVLSLLKSYQGNSYYCTD